MVRQSALLPPVTNRLLIFAGRDGTDAAVFAFFAENQSAAVGGKAKVECWSEQKWNPRGASKSGMGVDGDGWFPR